ncbi:hypothetical protein ANN_21622 [Periplaneta americana]|uniref:Uncharacterized protein n=1 Tax=Periplaneta americana TaxID=6978 RepID=A0ABQ8S694_PERAM|nr:hypothetical protein ANN_21622 [Periplaneta americana]
MDLFFYRDENWLKQQLTTLIIRVIYIVSRPVTVEASQVEADDLRLVAQEMNSRRVQNSISGLERDISSYEAYLSKLLNNMVDKPKSNVCKQVQNVASGIRERSAVPFVTGPLKRSNPSKSSAKSSHSTNHVLCKEIFGNNNATVEVTVKTKSLSNDKCRKRPRSNTISSAAENERLLLKDNVPKQSNMLFEPPVPSKLNRNVQYERKCQQHSNQKHLSWSHILKDKNSACIIHKKKTMDKISGIKSSTKGRRSLHSRKQTHRPRPVHTADDSLSSSSISDESSEINDQDSPQYSSKSIQCCLSGKEVPQNGQKEMPISSKNGSDHDGGNTFSIFNPVRTLNFLIKELRGRLQKCEEESSLHRIISDMEQALIRIPSDINTHKVKENNFEAPTRDETSKTRNGFVPLKTAEASLTKLPYAPRSKLVEQRHITEADNLLSHHLNEPTSRNSARVTVEAVTPPVKDIGLVSKLQVEQKEIELKYVTLERNYKQLELALAQQKIETNSLNGIEKRDDKLNLFEYYLQLTLIIIEGNKPNERTGAVECERKRLSYNNKLFKDESRNMTKKVEEQAKSIAELTASNAQLKEENKTLLPIRDAHATLSKRLKETSQEEGKTHAEAQMLKLEREKFEIVMASRNKEIDKLKKELRDIQAFASEQMLNLKSLSSKYRNVIEKGHRSNHDQEKQSHSKTDSDPESQPAEVTVFFEKTQTGGGPRPERGVGEAEIQPVCSSPTSSSLEVYPSWQKISRISSNKDTSKHSWSDVIVLSPTEKSKLKEKNSSDSEHNKTLSLVRVSSPNFKSFIMDSLSENGLVETSSESSTTEPKSCQELKDELKGVFDKIKKQARMGIGLTLPSPPQKYTEISEPGGMSQWSEISDDSVANSVFLSASNVDMNRAKLDFSASDVSTKKKFVPDS